MERSGDLRDPILPAEALVWKAASLIAIVRHIRQRAFSEAAIRNICRGRLSAGLHGRAGARLFSIAELSGNRAGCRRPHPGRRQAPQGVAAARFLPREPFKEIP